jgi:hypothetical protein
MRQNKISPPRGGEKTGCLPTTKPTQGILKTVKEIVWYLLTGNTSGKPFVPLILRQCRVSKKVRGRCTIHGIDLAKE